MSEADSKIFLLKRAVSEIRFKKHFLKQLFLCKSVHKSADAIFPIKQNKVKIIYSKQTKGQL
jgi:hypothetical protein